MTQYFRYTVAAIGAAVILATLVIGSSPSSRQTHAARYNLRSRTERFFDRATPSRSNSGTAAPARRDSQPKPTVTPEIVAG